MTDGVIAVTLLLIFAFGEHKVASLALAFICCAGLFALSAPLQILLLQNAKGGEMLGAAGETSPLTSAAPSAPSAAE